MIKKLKFSIIFNTNAAGGRKLKLINKVIELLKIDHSVELFKTSSEKDAEKVFSELSKNNTDRVVIAGGDGSVCFGINQIINKYKDIDKPIIGYIPAGTASILQIETQIEKKAKDILRESSVNPDTRVNKLSEEEIIAIRNEIAENFSVEGECAYAIGVVC